MTSTTRTLCTSLCQSWASGTHLGFQWGSKITTLVAAVRVSPRPPTCTASIRDRPRAALGVQTTLFMLPTWLVSRNTWAELPPAWKASTRACTLLPLMWRGANSVVALLPCFIFPVWLADCHTQTRKRQDKERRLQRTVLGVTCLSAALSVPSMWRNSVPSDCSLAVSTSSMRLDWLNTKDLWP